MTTFGLDPDPLDLTHHPAYALGYEHGWTDAPLQRPSRRPPLDRLLVSFALAVVLLVGIAIGRVSASAPRSALTTAPLPGASATTGSVGAPARVQASSSAGPTGAPSSRVAADGPLSLSASAESGVMPGAPPSPPTIRGVASWYDDGPGLYGAVHSWRWGDRRYPLTVCARGGRCVTVTIRDFCGCPGGRVVDLSPAAFARLAPLGRGLVEVQIRG